MDIKVTVIMITKGKLDGTGIKLLFIYLCICFRYGSTFTWNVWWNFNIWV